MFFFHQSEHGMTQYQNRCNRPQATTGALIVTVVGYLMGENEEMRPLQVSFQEEFSFGNFRFHLFFKKKNSNDLFFIEVVMFH